jgi:hypothetical protein
MPAFDGTGPRGQGPMTGRGEGYCAVKLPDRLGRPAYGYAGLQGRPVLTVAALSVPGTRFGRWQRPAVWSRRAFGRGLRPGRRAGRGRGLRLARR